MPGLEDVERELYEKETHLADRPGDVDLAKSGPPGAGAAPPTWTAPPKIGTGNRTKGIFYIILGAIAFVAVLIVAFVWYQEAFGFRLDKVDVQLTGPTDLASGSMAEWQVVITNRNRGTLTASQLDFEYPAGAFEFSAGLPTDASDLKSGLTRELIGDIASNKGATYTFKARLLGAKDDVKYAKATVSFALPGSSARHEKTASLATKIGSVPIVLTLNTLNQLISGGDINYEVNYFNSSQFSFSNLQIEVQYPPGFSFIEANPAPTAGRVTWVLPALAGSGQGIIKIHGTLSGQANEVKPFKVVVQTTEGTSVIKYTEAATATTILSSPLTLTMTMNNASDASIDIGGVLNYVLTYQNTLDVPLEDLSLTATLKGNIFDLESLKASGHFDGATNTIVWTGYELPDLKTLPPNAMGKTTFLVKLANRLPIINFQDKNFTVSAQATIFTKKVPQLIGGDAITGKAALVTKVNTRLAIVPKVFYRESSSSIQNFGPVPPRVGQTTTYSVHLSVINVANDADGVILKTTLPTGVVWTGQYTTAYRREGVSYDPVTKALTWNLGKLVATTGIAQPAKELVYQVSITPGPNDLYLTPHLVDNIIITGTDTFTGVALSAKAQGLTTSSLSDIDLGGQGSVKP